MEMGEWRRSFMNLINSTVHVIMSKITQKRLKCASLYNSSALTEREPYGDSCFRLKMIFDAPVPLIEGGAPVLCSIKITNVLF